MAFDLDKYKKLAGDQEQEQTQEPAAGIQQPADNENSEDKGFFNTPLKDSLSGMFNLSEQTRQNLYETTIEDAQHIDVNPDENEDNPGVGEWQSDLNEQTRANFVSALDKVAENPNWIQLPRDLRASALYQRVIMTPEEKFNKAKQISKETGLTTDAILQDETTYKNALALYDYNNKAKSMMGDNEQLDFNKVLDQFPELKNIADMDDDQMVQALHDMTNIRELHNIFNDNKSLWQQYTDYAKAAWEQGKRQREADLAWYRVSESEYGDEGREKALDLSRQAQEQAMTAPNMFNDPLKAAIFGAGTSLPEMLYSMMEGVGGAAVGAVAGLTTGAAAVGAAGLVAGPGAIAATPLIIGATAFGAQEGFWTGNVNAMRRTMQGQEYARLYEKGNKIYTHQEMQDEARKIGAINAVIEVAELRAFKGLMTPKKVVFEEGFKDGVRKLISKTAAKEAATGTAGEVAKKVGGEYAKNELPKIAAAPLAGAVGEFTDETLQSLTQDIGENILVENTGRFGSKKLSSEEIMVNAFDAGVQALPGGFAFGAFGVPYNFASATTGLGVQIQNQLEFQQKYTEEARHTILGANLLAGLQRVVSESKLKDTDAELQKKIIREQAAGSGFEMVYLDTASVLENENGMEQLEKIAEAAGYDEAALQEAINQGKLNVPVESFAQAQADSSVLTSASFDAQEPSIAELHKNAKLYNDQINAVQEQAKKEIEKIREIIVKQYFPDDADAADEAVIAMYDNPTNPAAGLREIEKNLLAARDSIIKPAMDVLQQGFGERPDIVVGDDGRGVRVSNNAPWYQKWFKENNRQITKADLVELATAMVTGEGYVPEVEGWRMDEEAYKASEEVRNDLKNINNELAVVARAKEKISDLTSAEVKNAVGLSEEGFSVYRALKDQLQLAPGTSSRAARVGAIILARHADRYAEIMQRKGRKNYTAKDYFAERFGLQFGGEEQAGGLAQMMEDVGEDNLIYRYTNTPNALSDYGHAMFSDAKEQTFSNDKYISVVNKDELLDIDEFLQLLAERIEEDAKDGTIYSYPQYMQDSLLDEDMELDNDKLQKFLEEYNPVDIVNSADAWDNKDFVNLAMEVASFNEVKGIKTSDGGIVFDDSIIKTFDNTKEEYKQTTMSITWSERQKTFLNDTEDVAREDQIFLRDGMISQANSAASMGQAAVDENGFRIDIKPDVRQEMAEVKSSWTNTDGSMKPGYMKAPNGQKSNLNEEQWLLVRTENFKKWFGDWEVREKKKYLINGETTRVEMYGEWAKNFSKEDFTAIKKGKPGARTMAAKKIRPYTPSVVEGTVIGTVNISNNSISATLHHSLSVSKIATLAYIEPMLKKAVKVGERKIEGARTSHILAAPIEADGQYTGTRFIAIMCVNEDEFGNKFYDHEFTTIKKLDAMPAVVSAKADLAEVDIKHQALDSILAEDLWNVNENNVSKVVDENGEPLVVYHGTPLNRIQAKNIETIHIDGFGDIQRVRPPFDTFKGGSYNGLIFFTEDEAHAKHVADQRSMNIEDDENGNEMWTEEGYVYDVFLNARKPFVVGDNQETRDILDKMPAIKKYDFASMSAPEEISKEEALKILSGKNSWMVAEQAEFLNEIKKQGYDALQANDEGVQYTAVFNPNQIKSATGNNGNFDANDNNIYHQGIKGSTTKLADGKRLIQLFESADESTFLHEMGHLFLMDLEDLAEIDEVSAKELAEVRDWAEWKRGDFKKYKDTPWAKEFADREQAIIDAEMNGDFDYADQLKRVWMHERFARGFELYLRDGKAPSKGLRAVFRSFAKFLRQVYSAFVSDDARASRQVEHIMGRMIATDAEIEAMSMDDQFKDFEKAGGEKLLNETERETYERWLAEAKEEAREKLQRIVLKDLKEAEKKKMEDYLQQEEADTRVMLEQLPVNLARKAIEALGGDEQGALVAFPTIEAFREADKAVPSVEQALKEHMDYIRQAYEKEYLDTVLNEEAVRQAMESSVYFQKAKELEAAALARKLDAKRKINTKAEQAMQGIQDALDALPEQYDLQNDKHEEPVRAIIAKINQLRFSTKWSAKDFAEIEKLIKAATREELQQELDNFRKTMKQQKLDIKTVEKANEGRLKLYNQIAEDAIAKAQIFNATNVNEHRRNQRKAEAMVKAMIKAGNIEMAIQQQQAAALSAAMAREATKAKERVDKLVAAVNRQLNAKSVKLPAKERYWHRHLAYLLRIGEVKDPDKPVLKKGQKLGDLKDLIKGYQDRLDLTADFDVEAVNDIISKCTSTGFRTLTIAEFEKVAELMQIIYKCGKDEFSLKTIAGKTIDEAVQDIIEETSLADSISIERIRIQNNTGGLGWNDWAAKVPVFGESVAKYGQSYLASCMKPEKILELLGEKAHRYIYGTFEQAVNDEAEMTARAVQDVQNMLKEYSHKELQELKDIRYELQLPLPEGGTETVRCSKENLLCMALNMGTAINRQRLTGGFFGPEMGQSEEEQLANQKAHTRYLMQFLADNLYKKDWELVQNIWNYLDTYWPDTARVEEELNGMHLEKQQALGFSIMTPEGEVMNMKGGYYPIKYNRDKNDKTGMHEDEDVAKKMGYDSKVLGTGRSHVKSRSEADVFHELQLTLDLIPSHLQQVIHNITTRLAARDVYRLLLNSDLSNYIEDHLGAQYRDLLRRWALDVWTQLPEKDLASSFSQKIIGKLRRNSVFSIMAYRVWPALENFSNIGPVADKLGYMNALGAVTEFYGHMSDFRQLMDKSVLMRNRLNNMDRDIRSSTGMFTADNKVIETIREHGYDLMTYSDLMFSAPLWCRAYKQAYMEQYRLVYAENQANIKKQQEAQAKLDKLRGELLDAKKDVQDWHAEKTNRAKAGQAGWQPGTSRFAVMTRSQFSILLPELQNKIDVLGRKVWEAEAEQGHAAELKILQGEELIKEAERRAVSKADGAVRDAFGSGRTVDLAAVSRTTDELVKAMSTFYSFFNTQFNSIYFKYLEGKLGTKPDMGSWEKLQAWAPFAKSILNRIVITSLIGSLLKMATKTDGDSDRDKWRKVKGKDGKIRKEEIPWVERFLKVFGKNALSMSCGAFWGFRDIANLALNYAFDGTDFGRGLNITSTPMRSADEFKKTFELIYKRSEHNLKLDEQDAAEQEKLRKMTSKQRKKYLEAKKYKKPQHRITFAEIFRHGANAVTGLSAATTGISSTLIDSVTGTMQYMLDTENRYDANWRNLIWSALFDKKPVEREVPQKPEEPKKKKKKK